MLLERMDSDGKAGLRLDTESISEAYRGPHAIRQALPKQPNTSEIKERRPSSSPDPLSKEWIFEPWPLLKTVSLSYFIVATLVTYFSIDVKVRFHIRRSQPRANKHTLVRYSLRAATARRSVVIHVAYFFVEKAHKEMKPTGMARPWLETYPQPRRDTIHGIF